MSEKVELKPCPFCGGQKIKALEKGINLDEGSVACYALVCDWDYGGCDASSGLYPTLEKAIEAWNRRIKNYEL